MSEKLTVNYNIMTGTNPIALSLQLLSSLYNNVICGEDNTEYINTKILNEIVMLATKYNNWKNTIIEKEIELNDLIYDNVISSIEKCACLSFENLPNKLSGIKFIFPEELTDDFKTFLSELFNGFQFEGKSYADFSNFMLLNYANFVKTIDFYKLISDNIHILFGPNATKIHAITNRYINSVEINVGVDVTEKNPNLDISSPVFKVIQNYFEDIKSIAGENVTCNIYIANSNYKPSVMRNMLITKTTGDLMLFRDDDDLQCSFEELGIILDKITDSVGEGVVKNKITVLPAEAVSSADASRLLGMWRYLFGMGAVREIAMNNPIGFTSGEDATTVCLLTDNYYDHLIILGKNQDFEICTHKLDSDYQKSRFDSAYSIEIDGKYYNAYKYMCPSYRYNTNAERIIRPFEELIYEYNSLQDNGRPTESLKNKMRDEFDDDYREDYCKIHPDTVLQFQHIDMKNPQISTTMYCFATFRPKRKAILEIKNNKPFIRYFNGKNNAICTARSWNNKLSPNPDDFQGDKSAYFEKRTKLYGGWAYVKLIILILSMLIIISIIITIICVCVNKNKQHIKAAHTSSI